MFNAAPEPPNSHFPPYRVSRCRSTSSTTPSSLFTSLLDRSGKLAGLDPHLLLLLLLLPSIVTVTFTFLGCGGRAFLLSVPASAREACALFLLAENVKVGDQDQVGFFESFFVAGPEILFQVDDNATNDSTF